jgi:hypothetical protein
VTRAGLCLAVAACVPEAPTAPNTPDAPTWDEVRPVLSRCAGCHDGSGLAVPLRTPTEVQRFAEPAAVAIRAGEMPPWPAGDADVDYLDDLRLTAPDQALLLAWLDAGAPGPDTATPAEAPPTAALPRIDGVLAMAGAWTPEGPEETRCFVLDRAAVTAPFVRGIRVVPGNPAVAHHLLLSAIVADDPASSPSALDAADPALGWACPEWLKGTQVDGLGGWLPGRSPTVLPPGVGFALPPEAELVLQAHYVAVVPGADRSEVELLLEDQVERTAAELRLANPDWITPALAVDAHATRTWRWETTVRRALPPTGLDPDRDVDVLAVVPHQHGHGARIAVSAVVDGEAVRLVDIPRWDYDWQLTYTLAEPLRLGPDDLLRLTCTFENDTAVPIAFGEQTTDEMCVARLLVMNGQD